MMRRVLSYGLAAWLLVALTGCRREPVTREEGMPILFSTSAMQLSAPATRSSDDVPHTSEYLIADGRKIAVFGTWTSADGESTNVFSKMGVTCELQNDNSVKWVYSPLKYWRRGGQYYFRAIFPYDVNTQYGTDGTRLVTSYSMFADNTDLMVAGSTRDMVDDDKSPVQLTFMHACAAVRVVFRKGSGDSQRHYLLNSCKMQYLHSVGVLVYDQDEVTLSSWQSAEFRSPSVMEWKASSPSGMIEVPASYTDFKQVTQNGWEQWHYVIPQNLNADDNNHTSLEFSVHVRQYQEDGVTLSYQTDEPVYTTLQLPVTYTDANNQVHDFIWEPGKTYTYYVQIQAGQASITVKVSDWDAYYVYVDDLIF